MTNLLYDLRYALRQLRKSPGFTVAAVLTLALGIGGAAAMFSVVDAVILRPLPYKNVDRIVQITTKAAANYLQPASWPEYLDMRRLSSTFSTFAGVNFGRGVTLQKGKQAIYLPNIQGTANFFDLYGVRPLLGRTFLPGEDQNGKDDVVVLSYEVWRQYFGGQKNILGQTIHLDGSPYTIVGVMPAGFRVRFDKPNIVYTPLHLSADQIKSRGSHWLPTFGLLKPGVTIAQANADMNHVLNEMGRQFPDEDKGKTAKVIPIVDWLHINQEGNNDRSQVWLLLAAVFAVLLIACTNVAGLLLARGLLREREMAVRAALGANRKRLVGQMLTESMVLGLGGAVAGIVMAILLLDGMQQFLERAFRRGGDVHLDLPVLIVTFVLSLLASTAAGLIPAWRAARMDPNRALKAGGNAGTTRHQHRLRAGFVVVQVALSLILLVCSGLLLLGLRNMLETNMGFNPKNLLTLEVDIPSGDYKGRNFVQALVQPLEARVQAIPGVTAVGSNDLMPIQEYGSNSDIAIVGKPVDPLDKQRLTEMRFITPGYFAAMQLPILKGRDFTAQDAATTQQVAIVNETWVKEFLDKKEDPLAQAFAGDPGTPNTAIVGVVRSGRQNISQLPLAEADFPMTQMPESWQAFVPSFFLFVRTSLPPTSITPQLRKVLHDIAPDVAFHTPETMENVLDDALVTNRMLSWLFGLFATIAVLLTAIGIYGLLSQEVASRTRDIGIRMALGATRTGVAQLVLTRVGILLTVGLTLGLIGVVLARQLLSAVLTIQFANDVWVIAAIALALGGIGLVSALLPVRRAASIDPMRALRAE
ncbi:MAG TPA: ABC transporter permease [Acidobacteriaceae bacterium]|jgi:predicted permease|nr:ABC transporter permease [Acidobacteriaceae bacterium]